MTAAYLQVVEGAGTGVIRAIDGRVTIGRGTGADFVLPDPAVSREHAAVWVEGVTVVVEDLGSSNGTWVNGERIEDAVRVGSGDVIQLGPVKLQVRIETGEAELRTPTEPTVIESKPKSA
jgi:pSer/pThr/pTyr-binding forkhead associated (FHA) protein